MKSEKQKASNNLNAIIYLDFNFMFALYLIGCLVKTKQLVGINLIHL